MGEIALHDYLSQIEQLLEENRLAEAASHCHFILQQHPRHVDTYRLFGRALLEQQLYVDATDIFQRVLSADPEDLISHAGLALAYKEKRQLARSIWHMERAFEIDPYNRAVRTELVELYGKRDGRPPQRLTLTRAGLARLYVKGDMQEQAVEELRILLDEQPDRIDLQTLLAEALWRADRRIECAEVCQDILDQLPYNIKANAILADIWRNSERPEEAQLHMQRLQALTLLDVRHLDPESVVGRAYVSNVGGAIPTAIPVNRLDYLPAEERRVSELTGWSGSGSGEVPDWLREIEQAAAPQMQPSTKPSQADDEMLEWLRTVPGAAVAGAALSREHGGEERPPREDLPAWLQRTVDWTDSTEGYELPGEPVEDIGLDSRDSTGDAAFISAERGDSNGDVSLPEAEHPAMPAVEEVAAGQLDQPGATSGSLDEAPKWLYEMLGLGAVAAAARSHEEAPDWTEPGPEETELIEETGELPEWLGKSAVLNELAGHEQAGANHQTEDRTMGMSEEPEKGYEAQAGGEESMDWLEELAAQNGIDDLSAVTGAELDALDWLKEEEPGKPLTEDAAAEWLDEQVDADATMIGPAAMAGVMASMAGETEPGGGEEQPSEELGEPDESIAEEDLSWLDQIASGEGQAIEEPLTMSWEDSAKGEEPPETGDEGGEEDLSWLEDLIEAEPTEAEDTGGLETIMATSAVSMTVEESDLLGEVPDDPDEAMAWLERLAARQGVPADELPSLEELEEGVEIEGALPLEEGLEEEPEKFPAPAVAGMALARDEAAAPELADQIPEDPDEAMAWLERLAEREGKPLAVTGEEAAIEEEIVAEAAELEGVEMPGSTEQALAWLYELAHAPAPPAEAGLEQRQDVVEEMRTPPDAYDVADEMAMAKILAEHEVVSEPEMPPAAEAEEFEAEDIDEAMAWLEQLAASQGAPPEELTSVEMEDDLAFALEEVSWEPTEAATTPPEAAVETSLESELAEELVQLPGERPGEGAADELDWLDTIGEVDTEAWLEAEEESSGKLFLGEVDLQEAIEAEGRPVAAIEEGLPYERLLEEIPPEIDAGTLEAARSAVAAGEFDQAIEAYTRLVEAGEGLPFVIADLEQVLEAHGGQLALRRLLGDAYAKNGQIQKALEAYRQALDEL